MKNTWTHIFSRARSTVDAFVSEDIDISGFQGICVVLVSATVSLPYPKSGQVATVVILHTVGRVWGAWVGGPLLPKEPGV